MNTARSFDRSTPVRGIQSLCGAIAFCALASPAFAQDAEPKVTLIRDAKIVTGTSRVIEKGSLLIRHGVIEDIGPDLEAPLGAEILEGEGLVVYPGFIGSHSQAGVEFPDPGKEDKGMARDRDPKKGPIPNMNVANYKGILPGRKAADVVHLEKKIEDTFRSQGFTATVAAPSGAYLGGTSCLLSLGGAPRRNSLIQPSIASHAAFRSAGSGYPSTTMGAIAHLRQTLLDAGRYRRIQQAYSRNPRGMTRPMYEPIYESIQPLFDGFPLYFEVDDELSIVRSIRISQEFGLNMAISGGREAFKRSAWLAEAGIPVAAQLAFDEEPKRREKKVSSEAPKAEPGSEPSPNEENIKEEAKDEKKEPEYEEPLDVFEDRHREWAQRVDNVKSLVEAGVPVLFANPGDSDFLEHLRLCISRGLAPKDALRALTSTPARVFSVSDRLGSIEIGKSAHLAIFDGPFHEDGSSCRYTFVDGHKFEGKKAPKASTGGPSSVTGEWSLALDSPMGERTSTLKLQSNDGSLSGELVSEDGSAEVASGSQEGAQVEFTVVFVFGENEFEIAFKGILDGDRMTGTVTTPMSEEPGKFTATRKPGSFDWLLEDFEEEEVHEDSCCRKDDQ